MSGKALSGQSGLESVEDTVVEGESWGVLERAMFMKRVLVQGLIF